MFETLSSYIGAASVLIVGFLAFSLGGKTEKIGAGGYILAWMGTLIAQSLLPFKGVQWGTLAMDLVALIVFTALVWKSGRSWPVWACALQLLAVSSHIMLIARLPTPVTSFYTVLDLAGYGILIAIGFGVFWAWQERRLTAMDAQGDGPLL